jgi:outer membrane autotransporter protein
MLALAGAIAMAAPPAVAQNVDSVGASATISANIAAAGDPIFAPAAGATLTISGVISDATPPAPLGQVSMQGQGTLILEGANTYSGGTIVQSGTLQLTGAGTLGASYGSTTVSGGTLGLGGTNQTQNGGLTLAGGARVQNGTMTSSGTFALQSGLVYASLAGTGGLTKTGAGEVDLLGANTYTGPTTVNAGILVSFVTNSMSAASPTTINAGGTLDFGAQTINSLKLSGGALNVGSLTGAITSTGGSIFYLSGPATLTTTDGTTTFSGVNSYTGATTVKGGTLTASDANAFPQFSPTTILAGGTVDLGGVTQAISMVNLAGGALQNGSLTGNITSTGGAMNGIGGPAGLTTTAGTTVLSGSNSYSGPTSVNGGVLTASATNAFSPGSVTTINAGGALDLGGFAQAINTVSLAGGTIRNGAVYAQGLPPWSPGPTISSTGGAISNLGGIVGLIVTAGTTTLSGTNTYVGGTDVAGGALTASAANAFSPGGETFTLITTHGTVDLGGFAQTINLVDLDGGTLQHGSLTGAILSGGGAISGLSGSATLTTEEGVTTLSGVNGYTGATTVGATLTASTANAFAPASVTTIGLAGIVNLAGLAQTIHTVNLSGGDLTNGSLSGAVTSTGGYIDGLGGSATLTTTGGTTVLSTFFGPNAYTGSTIVNGGILTADNVKAFSSASVMTINIAGEVDLGAREQTINTVNLFGGAFGDGSLTSANGVVSTGGSVASLGGTTALTANGGMTALLNNTYTGATTINSGATVTGYSVSAFSPNSALTINAGGVADLGGYNQTVASLSGSGTVTNSGAGAAVLTTGGDNTSTAFGGLISDGTGRTGLAKTGTGSLVLTDANTYSGGTSVAGGVLGVGADGALGSGALTLQPGTTLRFEASGLTIANPIVFAAPNGAAAGGSPLGGAGGSTSGGGGGLTSEGAGDSLGGASVSASGAGGTYTSDGAGLSLASANLSIGQLATVDPTIDTGPFTDTVSGVISGPGDLTKIGSGTLILSGANTYTGSTDVQAGTLTVNGSIVSTATVETGATIGGSGAIGSLIVARGGAVAPGVLTPYSTLTVNGSASFAPGSIFATSVNAAGQNDKLAVTGATTISGGAVQVAAAPGSYTAQSKYTLISADGGVSGTFASLSTNLNMLGFLTPVLSYDADDVYLAFAVKPFATVAQTPNQIATATALSAQPVDSSLYDAIIGQTAPGALTAFNALSGEIHPSAVGAALDDTRLPREAVLDRLSLPYASGPTPSGAQTVKTLMQPTPATVFSAWGQAFDSWGHLGGDGNAATVSNNLGGFILGTDATLSGRYRLGVVGGYADASLELPDRGSSGNVGATYFGLYGGASGDALQLRGGAFYADNHYRLNRAVSFPNFSNTVESGYGGDTLQAFAEAGWRIPVGAPYITASWLEPFGGLTGVDLHTASFVENPGPAALVGASETYGYGIATLGVRGEASLYASAPLTANAMIGWQHMFGGETPTSTLAFATAPLVPFSIAGAPIARDALALELGVDWRLTANVKLSVYYSGLLSSSASDDAIKAKLEASF